jgi:hypothetical protein
MRPQDVNPYDLGSVARARRVEFVVNRDGPCDPPFPKHIAGERGIAIDRATGQVYAVLSVPAESTDAAAAFFAPGSIVEVC